MNYQGWFGSDMSKAIAKVIWEHICLPKEEGGLGIKSILQWKEAAILKQLRALSNKADILWVKWVHTHIIKGHCI